MAEREIPGSRILGKELAYLMSNVAGFSGERAIHPANVKTLVTSTGREAKSVTRESLYSSQPNRSRR